MFCLDKRIDFFTMDRESKGFHQLQTTNHNSRSWTKKRLSSKIECRVQTGGFEGITFPDVVKAEPSKKAIKAQLKFAKTALKEHIAALSGKALSKAFKANCDSKKEPSVAEMRKSIKNAVDEMEKDELEKWFALFGKVDLSDKTMQGKLNAKFKKADVNEIWHFIAENPLPKVKKAKKEEPKTEEPQTVETEDNGEAQEI